MPDTKSSSWERAVPAGLVVLLLLLVAASSAIADPQAGPSTSQFDKFQAGRDPRAVGFGGDHVRDMNDAVPQHNALQGASRVWNPSLGSFRRCSRYTSDR